MGTETETLVLETVGVEELKAAREAAAALQERIEHLKAKMAAMPQGVDLSPLAKKIDELKGKYAEAAAVIAAAAPREALTALGERIEHLKAKMAGMPQGMDLGPMARKIDELKAKYDEAGVALGVFQAKAAVPARVAVNTVIDTSPLATAGVASAALRTGAGMGSLQQSVTAASYAFQDFTSSSGDLGMKLNSISNNIPMIVGGMGTLGIAVSVVSTASIALYRNWDSIASLWQARNPFLDAAESANTLEKSLAKNNTELEKLQELATLSNNQLVRMAELTKLVADEENRLAAIRGAQKVREAPGPAQQLDTEEFASIKKQLGGPQIEADLRKMILSQQPQTNKASLDAQVNAILANLERGTAKALEGLRDMAAAGHGAATPLGKALFGIPAGPPAARALTDFEKKGAEEEDKRFKAAQKAADEARAKRDKAGREAEKAGDEAALGVADLVNPGLRDAAQKRLDRSRRTGGKEADVQTGLAKLLAESGGLDEATAADAAKGAMERARRDLAGGGAKKLREERRKRAEESVPAFDAQADAALVAGIPPAELGRRITATLKARGFGADEAGEAAGDAVKDARKRAGEKLTKDYLSTVDSIREARLNERLNAHSETFATSDLTARVQSGVGQLSEAQKQTEKLGLLIQQMQALNDKPVLFVRAKP